MTVGKTGRRRRIRLPRERRYTFLMAVLLLMFAAWPFMDQGLHGLRLMDIFLTFILLSVVYAESGNKSILIINLFLVILAISSRWINFLFPSRVLVLMSLLSDAGFFTVNLICILADVLKDERVTSDKISGAVCVYILMGLTWAFFYAAVEVAAPGSFQLSDKQSLAVRTGFFGDGHLPILIYFSLVTMTTLGFGDITPHSSLVYSLSTLEAIVGQLYLTVLVARLVALHISHSLGSRRTSESQTPVPDRSKEKPRED